MKLTLFLGSMLLFLTASAQVVNDDIARRLPLSLNASFSSNTTHCTVQWNCVDTKAVTGCILFHNDQWFEFTTRQAGTYYLTVTNQKCRDVRGIQVLVLDGNPCEPSTYKYLVCHSTGSQDDISLTLDSLQANHTYLLNIDGYLNDFCQFDITLRTQLPDFAIFTTLEPVPVQTQVSDSVVQVKWTLPDSLKDELTDFYLLRRHSSEKRSREITRFAAISNAYGSRQSAYLHSDTVNKEGVYSYKIIGVTNQERNYLLKEVNVAIEFKPKPPANPDDILQVEIPVKKKLNVEILLIDAQTDKLLKKTYMLTSAKNKNVVRFNISYFVEQGIRKYKVIVQELDKKQGYTKTFLFSK